MYGAGNCSIQEIVLYGLAGHMKTKCLTPESVHEDYNPILTRKG